MDSLLHKYINSLINQYNLHDQKELINNILQISFEDDFDQHYQKIESKKSLNLEMPFEFSARFDLVTENCLRFSIHPMWFYHYEDRIITLSNRFIKILHISGMQDKIKQFKQICNILTNSNNFSKIIWYFLFSYIFSENGNKLIKVAFIPISSISLNYFGTRKKNNYKRRLEWRDIMNLQKEYQEQIRDRIITLFKSQGLQSEIQKFQKIYKILIENDSLEDKGTFISFIGVDFEKGKDPSFKIYFNPNNLIIK